MMLSKLEKNHVDGGNSGPLEIPRGRRRRQNSDAEQSAGSQELPGGKKFSGNTPWSPVLCLVR